MSHSGLDDTLGQIYAENTFKHKMSGKAVSRAVRGHMITDAALNALLVADIYDIDLEREQKINIL